MPAVGQQQLVFRRGGSKIEDTSSWHVQGSIYYDGSCYRGYDEDLSRAAFAVVEVDGSGQPAATLLGTVPPSMPQTSQAAEQCGRAAAVQLLAGSSELVGDCQTVVNCARLPDLAATHHKRMYAGMRRLALVSGRSNLVRDDRKVQAHRSIHEASDANDRIDILGNSAADSFANEAQMLHDLPSPDVKHEIDRKLSRLRSIVRVLVATVPLWPPIPKGLE
eukprot:12428148-Karenia_brevis.AAC.1